MPSDIKVLGWILDVLLVVMLILGIIGLVLSVYAIICKVLQ